MTPTGSRSLPVAVLALALLATPAATSYAAERPHTHDEYVAHTQVVGAPTPFPVSGLDIGEAPRIAYAFASDPGFGDGNWLLRRTDGTSLKLPRLTWGVWAPMGDGAIGMAGTEAGPELQQVSGTVGVRSRLIEHFGLGVSPDHEIVGWLGDHGRPHVVEGGGIRRFTLPRVAHGNVLTTVSGTETCQEQEPEGGGCTVFVNGERHVRVSTSHGIVGTAGPMLAVSDVSARGRIAGLVSRRTDHHRACFGVFRAGGHRVFKTCHYYVDTFSPDGRRVLAERSQVQWASVRRFAILGHDGHVVRLLDLRRRQQPQPLPAHLGGQPPPARRPAGTRAVGSGADRHRRNRGVRRSPGRRHRRVRAVQPAAALRSARPRRPLRPLQPSSPVSRLGRDT